MIVNVLIYVKWLFHSLSVTEMSEFFLFKIMKDMAKAAMKAALADMSITLDKFNKLELSVKQMTEIAADDAIIRNTVTIEE